jgi:Lactate racemase N-terminal domain
MPYPLMFRLGQRLHSPTVGDVPAAVETELFRLGLGNRVKPGDTVAVTCGSRRIANYAVIVKAVVDHFKQLGAIPFLIPAMGSHGAGTAEGQREVLHALGITEEIIGAEIRSATETEIIGQLAEGVPVFCDKHALRANHTVVVNRVRPHPLFHGDVQSGLLKMITIGLGKLDGARHYHRAVENSSFEDIARGVYKVMLKNANLLAGLLIIESGNQGTASVQGVLPEDFVAKERAILQRARALFPQLPFKFIDILLVDEIGTPFGCLGVDSNATGRKFNAHAAAEGEFPQIRTIVYRDLNPQSRGNATGVGHGEFVRSRLLRKTDAKATRLNSLTVGMPALAATPIDFETDREILDAALSLIGSGLPEKARIVWIRNTSSMVEFECSEPYLDEVQHWKDLSVLSGLHPLEFDRDGNLRDFVIE